MELMIMLKVTKKTGFYVLYIPKNTFLEKTQGGQTDPSPLQPFQD